MAVGFKYEKFVSLNYGLVSFICELHDSWYAE